MSDENTPQASGRAGGARARNRLAMTAAVVAALMLAITPAALWMRNVVFDTDTWVATVGPLADDPAIQDAVAKAASDALVAKVDAQDRIAGILPDVLGLDRFAPLLAASVDSAIRSQTTAVVRSEQFGTIWREINRESHKALIGAVTGRRGAFTAVEEGTLTLDTGALVDAVKQRLAERGLGFIANVPTSRADREIVLFQSDALAAAGRWARGIRALAYAIPVIGLALLVAAFLVARDRQRVALALGVALTAFGVLPTQAVYLAQYSAVRSAEKLAGIPTAAAHAAFDIIFRDLITADRVVVYLGVAVLVAALFAGPSRWAKAARGAVTGGLSAAGEGLGFGAFGAWVGAHRPGLRAAGFVVAAVLLVTLEGARTLGGVAWIAGLAAAWVAAVEFVGAAGARPEQAAQGSEAPEAGADETPGAV